jgi:hypothetical protein
MTPLVLYREVEEEGRMEHGLEPKISYDEKRESVALISRLYPTGIVWSFFYLLEGFWSWIFLWICPFIVYK